MSPEEAGLRGHKIPLVNSFLCGTSCLLKLQKVAEGPTPEGDEFFLAFSKWEMEGEPAGRDGNTID